MIVVTNVRFAHVSQLRLLLATLSSHLVFRRGAAPERGAAPGPYSELSVPRLAPWALSIDPLTHISASTAQNALYARFFLP